MKRHTRRSHDENHEEEALLSVGSNSPTSCGLSIFQEDENELFYHDPDNSFVIEANIVGGLIARSAPLVTINARSTVPTFEASHLQHIDTILEL